MSTTISSRLVTASYGEVKAFAATLAQRLAKVGCVVDAGLLADEMVNTATSFKSATPMSQEEQLFQKIFSKQRSLLVQLHRRPGATANGWVVNCSSLPAGNAAGNDLRQTISMLLDQVLTMHVMTEGK